MTAGMNFLLSRPLDFASNMSEIYQGAHNEIPEDDDH